MDRMRPTTTSRRLLATTAATGLALTLALASAAPATADRLAATPASGKPGVGHCPRMDKVKVKGAERIKTACLADLTTAGTSATGHTNPAAWAGLNAAGTTNPTGVPGIQVDGYFPDTSTTNTNNGWQHDSQFVVRIPDAWNGKLVVSGSPGNRAQYANDFILSDWVLAQGYAFASTDKGNVGLNFWDDGSTPGGSVREWNSRVTQLTEAVQDTVKRVRAGQVQRTYMAGISNGGYLVRWQLENRPDLYDGGLDWEGTLFRADGPNLLTYLPTALKNYPTYAAGGPGANAAHDAMTAAGFAPGSEFLWPIHHQVYWDLTQRVYREEFDPSYDGDLKAGIPYCTSGTPRCDADYDYATRPAAVHEAVRSVELTGRIGKPLLSLQGDLDTLLPIATDQDVYAALVAEAGHGGEHAAYRVQGGTHTDGFAALWPDRLRPMLPCARTGFSALTQWVESGVAPPAEGEVTRPASGDLRTTCPL